MRKLKKRTRTFVLHITLYGVFENVKKYLMEKYTVYTANFSNGIAYFRISYLA